MKIRPTPEQRAEMAACIDAQEPGLLDELGIPRDEPRSHACNTPYGPQCWCEKQ